MSTLDTTAAWLTTVGLLLTVSVVFGRASGRIGLPVPLAFLGLGMIVGEDGLGLPFSDFEVAFRLGTVALTLILFDAGLNTPVHAVRRALRPALVLATAGVALTAAIVALGAGLLGLPWPVALLLGAVVSSTDAAAVFAVLRGSGLRLKERLGLTLELESGLNDPLAVILTVTLTEQIVGADRPWWLLLPEILWQFAVGAVVGWAMGRLGRVLLGRLSLPVAGLYPVLTLGLALLAFGVPSLLSGSGFVAVYVAAVILGDGPLPYRTGLVRVHDAVAWFAQVAMFLLLGLLVTPSQLLAAAPIGFGVALLLGLLARPAAVALCMWPFRFPRHEVLYLGWAGLRGAVPIVLATFPVLAQVPGAIDLFHIVFFVVVVDTLLHGGTVRWLTQKLDLSSDEPPPPPAVVEITSTQVLSGELLSFFIAPASAVADTTIADIPFPDGAAVTLVVRGRDLIAPKGGTRLEAGDYVYIFCRPEDRAWVGLMFGRPTE